MGNSEIYMDGSFNLHYPDGATQFDDMPDELREVVDDYWGQFPPQHPLIKDAFGVLLASSTLCHFLATAVYSMFSLEPHLSELLPTTSS